MGKGDRRAKGERSASSAAAAAKVGTIHKGAAGFGFGGFSGSQRVEIAAESPVPGAERSPAQAPSPGVSADAAPPLSSELDGDISQHFKQCSKADQATRRKALQALRAAIPSKPQASLCVAVLPWCYHFKRLVLDNSRSVRLEAVGVATDLATSLGRAAAPALPQLLGPWLMAEQDPHKDTAAAASAGLQGFLPGSKRDSAAVMFRGPVVAHLASVLASDANTLGDPRREEPHDLADRRERAHSQALLALGALAAASARVEHGGADLAGEIVGVLEARQFLPKHAADASANVRAAMYAMLRALTQAPALLDRVEACVAPVVLGALGEREPLALPAMLDMLVLYLKHRPGVWAHAGAAGGAARGRLVAALRASWWGASGACGPATAVVLSLLPESVVGAEREGIAEMCTAMWRGASSDPLRASRQAMLGALEDCAAVELSRAHSDGADGAAAARLLRSFIVGELVPAATHPDTAPYAVTVLASVATRTTGAALRALLSAVGAAAAEALSPDNNADVHAVATLVDRLCAREAGTEQRAALLRPLLGKLSPAVAAGTASDAAAGLLERLTASREVACELPEADQVLRAIVERSRGGSDCSGYGALLVGLLAAADGDAVSRAVTVLAEPANREALLAVLRISVARGHGGVWRCAALDGACAREAKEARGSPAAAQLLGLLAGSEGEALVSAEALPFALTGLADAVGQGGAVASAATSALGKCLPRAAAALSNSERSRARTDVVKAALGAVQRAAWRADRRLMLDSDAQLDTAAEAADAAWGRGRAGLYGATIEAILGEDARAASAGGDPQQLAADCVDVRGFVASRLNGAISDTQPRADADALQPWAEAWASRIVDTVASERGPHTAEALFAHAPWTEVLGDDRPWCPSAATDRRRSPLLHVLSHALDQDPEATLRGKWGPRILVALSAASAPGGADAKRYAAALQSCLRRSVTDSGLTEVVMAAARSAAAVHRGTDSATAMRTAHALGRLLADAARAHHAVEGGTFLKRIVEGVAHEAVTAQEGPTLLATHQIAGVLIEHVVGAAVAHFGDLGPVADVLQRSVERARAGPTPFAAVSQGIVDLEAALARAELAIACMRGMCVAAEDPALARALKSNTRGADAAILTLLRRNLTDERATRDELHEAEDEGGALAELCAKATRQLLVTCRCAIIVCADALADDDLPALLECTSLGMAAWRQSLQAAAEAVADGCQDAFDTECAVHEVADAGDDDAATPLDERIRKLARADAVDAVSAGAFLGSVSTALREGSLGTAVRAPGGSDAVNAAAAAVSSAVRIRSAAGFGAFVTSAAADIVMSVVAVGSVHAVVEAAAAACASAAPERAEELVEAWIEELSGTAAVWRSANDALAHLGPKQAAAAVTEALAEVKDWHELSGASTASALVEVAAGGPHVPRHLRASAAWTLCAPGALARIALDVDHAETAVQDEAMEPEGMVEDCGTGERTMPERERDAGAPAAATPEPPRSRGQDVELAVGSDATPEQLLERAGLCPALVRALRRPGLVPWALVLMLLDAGGEGASAGADPCARVEQVLGEYSELVAPALTAAAAATVVGWEAGAGPAPSSPSTAPLAELLLAALRAEHGDDDDEGSDDESDDGQGSATAAFCRAVFSGVLQRLPGPARQWFVELRDRRLATAVEEYVSAVESPAAIAREIAAAQDAGGKMQADGLDDDNQFELRASTGTREVSALLEVEDGASLELCIKLPASWPLRHAEVECRRKVGLTDMELRKWVMGVAVFLRSHSGTVGEAVSMWRRRALRKFSGVEPCLICYSVVHPANRSLPRMSCQTCAQNFHAQCLYKWFKSSGKSNCPHCQSPW
ncbi:unnamed protein product [Pedinophyceae sp. YPF-701]|nr:unnamed protein product [Pedinophyceae sp. YPF-701]